VKDGVIGSDSIFSVCSMWAEHRVESRDLISNMELSSFRNLVP